MSETPPIPPQYAAYPRPDSAAGYGSTEKLTALSEGYFGLNTVFIINLVLALAVNAAAGAVGWIGWVVGIVVLFGVVAGLSHPQNKKIAFGKDWTPSQATLASVLMGLNSALCCGLLGFIVMQSIAGKEIRRYGVKPGFFGLRKKDVQKVVEARRAAEATPAVPPTFG